MNELNGIDNAVDAIRNGDLIVIIDDADRENEGDLVVAAEHATPVAINFMITHGRGLVCIAIGDELAHSKDLYPMVQRNEDDLGTAFTVTVDASPVHGVTTGISAFDRAKTVGVIIDPNLGPESLRRPGHTFPLIAQPHGVLARRGHTEASTDICAMAGLTRAAVIVEVLRDDGSMAREPELRDLARRFGLVTITVDDLVLARKRNEALITDTVGVG